MVRKKVNPETAKIGKKCIISFKGNDRFHVTFAGTKDGMYLYADAKDKHLIYRLTKAEANSKVFTEVK